MTSPVDPPEHPVAPGPPQPVPLQPGYPSPGYPGPEYAPTSHLGQGYSGPGYAGPGYAGPGYVTPGYPMPGPAHPAPGGPPWPAPPGGGPPPPSKSPRRTWLWIALGAVAFVVVAVIVIVTVVVVAGSGDDGDSAATALVPGDDTVHPEEIGSIAHPVPADLAPMPTEPTVKWSSGRSLPGWWGANSTALILGSEEYSPSVTVVDAATGRTRFTSALPPGRFIDLCAATDARIACATATKGPGAESLTVLDAHTGAHIADTPLPAQSNAVQQMYAVGDRFIVSCASATESGTMISTDANGTVTWSGQGSGVAGDQPIIVRTDAPLPNSSELSLLRAADGKPIASLSRSTARRFPTVPFTVYQGGVAVMNAQGTGTDFYSSDGTRTGFAPGWAPAAENYNIGSPAPPAPILGRIASSVSKTSHIIGAANPMTGHLIWRRTGSEFTASRLTAEMTGDLLGIRLGKAGGSTDPSTYGGTADTDGPLQLFDPMTGANRSVPIKVDPKEYLTDVLNTDGERLITSNGSTLTAYDMATGQQAWEFRTDGEHLINEASAVYSTVGYDGVSMIGP
ncbi:PQQ-binding-like beta-propeller repeat protein [Gordonia sp. DT30]|uniref:outer membrane protein assembly factor BamB family protein n=1 Tax=unclassified Gordonia (in: high G+C Gram-positive bacteria) TaxID=2657482 RepID=UPI003CE9B70D